MITHSVKQKMVLALVGTTLPASAFDDYFFFGDSLSDSGNLNLSSGGFLPGMGYPGPTFSNGLTWAGYTDPSARNFIELSTSMTPTTGSVNFAFGGAETASGGAPPGLLDQVNTHLPSVTPLVEIDADDVAAVWAGANDLMGAAPGTEQATAAAATTNIATAVSNLANVHGFKNIYVFNLPDLGTTPRSIMGGPAAQAGASQLSSFFNSSLSAKVGAVAADANITLIDVNALLSDAVANPTAYGISIVDASANPNAGSGVPSTLTPAQEAEYLFYDEIHPTTNAHEIIAAYVAAHSSMSQRAEELNLSTDAALAMDDRFGFETLGLKKGSSRLNAELYSHETGAGMSKRTTEGAKVDLDFGITDHLSIGGEFFYAKGNTSGADYDAIGFGMDAALTGTTGNLLWEVGGGIGFSTGDLTRDHNIGTLSSDSTQHVSVLTLHAALRNDNLEIGGRKAYWELGVKQRLVYRDARRENGGGSLDLAYDSESIYTTIANIEFGIALTNTVTFELALNPVLFHDGGEIHARQTSGLGAFSISDYTGYDSHTARIGLSAQVSDNATIGASVVIGDDDTLGGNIGATINF
ncbi:MAG: SGNH/GDSL hydrolase family protein [Akkermansiaceae bacterium]